ncbi:MAG: M20/M25/M40 family metallo-hydrolase [Cyclobacteriaceae bacterium]
MKLLQQLIDIASPSGSEYLMKDFLIDYIKKHAQDWAVEPKIISTPELQDNLIVVFGEPRTAIFAHMDTIGFTVRYQDQLVPIGGPDVESGYDLVGKDALGTIQCKLRVDEDNLFYDFPRAIETGTTLTWQPNLHISDEYIQGPYMDNRLGIYNALKVAETLQDGVLVFSSFEEHGGGSVPMLVKYLAENFSIKQALISDITWVTEGVQHGGGVAISMRDRHIPRKLFLNKILELADSSGIQYQLEVEGSGSSDGREVHFSPYPIDWIFIGAPEDNVHSPNEKVHIKDLTSMIAMYSFLMAEL